MSALRQAPYLAVALVAMAAACSEVSGPRIAFFIGTPVQAVVLEDDSIRIPVVLADASGDTIPDGRVAWVADDTTIATVSSDGVVRYRFPGRLHVIVLRDGLTRSIDVTSAVTYASIVTGMPGCGSTTRGTNYCLSIFGGTSPTVTPIATGLHDVSSYNGTVCGLAPDDHPWCYLTGPGNAPSVVAGGQRFRQFTNGATMACGIGLDSLAYCLPFGFGAAQPVGGSGKYVAWSMAARSACGVTVQGTVDCWGDGLASPLTAAPVAGVTFAQSVSWAGNYGCAVNANGAVVCWGSNTYGQLGRTCASSCTAAPVPSLPPMKQVVTANTTATSSAHTCALAVAGVVYCWGSNVTGSLGDGTTVARLTPAPVAMTGEFVALSTAKEFPYNTTCALRKDGVQWCWGNHLGQTPVALPYQP